MVYLVQRLQCQTFLAKDKAFQFLLSRVVHNRRCLKLIQEQYLNTPVAPVEASYKTIVQLPFFEEFTVVARKCMPRSLQRQTV